MRLCIFAKIKFLAAVTTFELFSPFFHMDHLPWLLKRNGCATHGAELIVWPWDLCFIFAKEIP
jgi:hypothetical protein